MAFDLSVIYLLTSHCHQRQQQQQSVQKPEFALRVNQCLLPIASDQSLENILFLNLFSFLLLLSFSHENISNWFPVHGSGGFW